MGDERNFSKNELNSKCFSKKFSTIILPAKKVLIDWIEAQTFCTDTPNDADSQRIRQCVHNESEFYILCFCTHCLNYKKDILQIFNDHIKTQKIWKFLEKAISKLYLPLIENASPEILEMYDYLIARCSNWLVNGIINKVKQEHINFLLDFPWTDKMVVVIFSVLLIEDDSYQLFQLMSFLVECFVKVYASALISNFKNAAHNLPPSKFLLTYILNGYTKLCSIAEVISEMLFHFERNYLKKFKCSWILLNKKMYHKYCYSILSTVLPEFVIKLQEEVSDYECRTLITKFKEFEMDMILTENAWQEVDTFFNEYQISEDNQNRKARIDFVNTIFNIIYTNHPFNSNITVPEWKTHEIEWDQMVSHMKKNWSCLEKEVKMKVIMQENHCQHCQYLRKHNKTFCTCILCLKSCDQAASFEEKNTDDVTCIKCSFMKAVTNADFNLGTKLTEMSLYDKKDDSEAMTNISENEVLEECSAKILKTEVYHYCWAVFKHLKDRKAYQNTIIEADLFCKNCRTTSCLLATKILSNEISDEVAKYLIKHYQPFAISNEEIMQMLPKIWLSFKKGYFPHDQNDEDFIIKTFWIFVISAYATCLVHLDIKQNIPDPDIGRLVLTSNDIELLLPDKESRLQSSDLLEFIEKIINSLQANRKAVNSNTKVTNHANIDVKLNTFNLSGTDNNVEDLNLISKEMLIKNEPSNKLNNNIENFCNSGVKDCEDNIKPAKEANSNKPTCFHEKEYRYNRKNETRDRLREKLRKLVNIDKKILPLPPQSEPVLASNDKNLQNAYPDADICSNSARNEESTGSVFDVKKDICEYKKTFKINGDEKWVKDALSYIEGSKNGNVVNNKKAAKRQKQKLKKEEYKRLEELKDLKSQFHEVYFKEFMSKKERKTEQLSKKKDKKRILDLENSIKKLSKIKLRIEREILALISSLKSINSEFKFTYLPTKEQQQDFLKTISQEKDTISNCCQSIHMIKSPKEEVVPFEVDAQVLSYKKNESIQFSKTERDMTDASKRIVTIRRVNLPNNNEPQVTVTAKGSSPDEDKILYTVINGRLVQRDCGNSSVLEKSPRINFTQLSEIKNALLQNNIMSCIGYNPNNDKSKHITKTKTQIKKDRKIAKKLLENLKDKNKVGITTNTQLNKTDINLKIFNDNDYPNIPNKEIGNSAMKCKQKNEKYKCHQHIYKNSKDEIKSFDVQNEATNFKQKENNFSVQQNTSKTSDKIIQQENNDNEKKNIKVTKKNVKDAKKKNSKVHMLANNQFNLLHLEDSESFTEESEPDIDTSNSKKVLLKNKPSIIIESNSKNSTIQSKLAESIMSTSCSKKKAKCKDRTQTNCSTGVKTNFQYSSNHINFGNTPEKKIIALDESMNNLNINLNSEHLNKRSNVTNISIMEQLKRGIQVENLTLPPGITLTKVDPAKAEELKAKAGSIHNLSQQILPQQSSVHSLFSAEDLLRTDFLPPTVNKFLTDSKGVIMVDNITKKAVPPKNTPQCLNSCKNKTKIKKRKNRNKSRSISETKLLPETKKVASNIITLRNPMFYLSNPETLPYCNLTERLPQTSDPQIDQPATIIRNKNGMFTIRNPVLYQNMAGSNFINNYGAFSPNYYSSMRSFLQDGDSSSYLSDNAAINSGKCMSPIGSEMKTAQQKQCTLFQNSTLKNQNYTSDSCDYVNGLKSFVPHDSLLYNYCASTSSISKNNTCRSTGNVQQKSLNKNGTSIHSKIVRNNCNKVPSLVDLKRLNNEVTIHNMRDKELPPQRIGQVLNQRHSIDAPASHNYELENQQTHFKIFNNLQVPNTDYLKSNGLGEIQANVNNKGCDPLESALLQTLENNIFCSINSCNEQSLFSKKEPMCSRSNKI